MTIDTMILLAGTFVAVAPFIGLPPEAYGILYFFAGVCIIGLGIAVRRRGLQGDFHHQEHHHSDFVESAPHSVPNQPTEDQDHGQA